MNLWIRSQDKEFLGKITKIFYSHNTDNNKHCIRTFVTEDFKSIIELGEYSSKERALEVLDEIDNLIGNETKYQMPKE